MIIENTKNPNATPEQQIQTLRESVQRALEEVQLQQERSYTGLLRAMGVDMAKLRKDVDTNIQTIADRLEKESQELAKRVATAISDLETAMADIQRIVGNIQVITGDVTALETRISNLETQNYAFLSSSQAAGTYGGTNDLIRKAGQDITIPYIQVAPDNTITVGARIVTLKEDGWPD